MADKQKWLTSAELSQHLTTLILKQDEITKAWFKFLITFESALIALYGYVFLLKDSPLDELTQRYFQYVTAIIGLSVALVVMLIIIRERNWEHFFVRQFNKIPGNAGKVWPITPGAIGWRPVGVITWLMSSLIVAVIIGWVAILLLTPVKASSPNVASATHHKVSDVVRPQSERGNQQLGQH